PPCLWVVHDAWLNGQSVRFRYVSDVTGQPRAHEVLPYRVFCKWGHWYLQGRPVGPGAWPTSSVSTAWSRRRLVTSASTLRSSTISQTVPPSLPTRGRCASVCDRGPPPRSPARAGLASHAISVTGGWRSTCPSLANAASTTSSCASPPTPK